MPGHKRASFIDAIHFEKPIQNPDNLQQLFGYIKTVVTLVPEIFLLPKMTVTKESFKRKGLKGFLLKFEPVEKKPVKKSNESNESKASLAERLIPKGIELLADLNPVSRIQPGAIEANTFHIIFSTDVNDNYTGIATDCDPNLFRQLMLLFRGSQRFCEALQKTDYWILDWERMKAESIKPQGVGLPFHFLGGLIDTLQSGTLDAQQRREQYALGVESLTNLMNCSKPGIEEYEKEWVPKTNRAAFKAASDASRGEKRYTGTLEEFGNPLLEINKQIVRDQIVQQLVAAKVLPNPGACTERQLALFVGEGSGENMLEILRQYPNMIAFALEISKPSLAILKGAIGENRVFSMALEDFRRLHNIFHYIFIFNYNLSSLQEAFFKKASELVRPGGTVVVGRSVCDPQHICSSRVIDNYLEQFLGKKNVRTAQSLKETIQDCYRQVLYIGTGRETDSKEEMDVPSPLTVEINRLNGPYRAAAEKDLENWNKGTYGELERIQGELTVHAELERIQRELTLAGKLGAAAAALIPAAVAVPDPVVPVPGNPALLPSASSQPAKPEAENLAVQAPENLGVQACGLSQASLNKQS